MAGLDQLVKDKDFRAAPYAEQAAYLKSVDPDFAKASPADQTAYVAHILNPSGAPAKAPNEKLERGAPETPPSMLSRVGNTLAGPIGMKGVAENAKELGRDVWNARGLEGMMVPAAVPEEVAGKVISRVPQALGDATAGMVAGEYLGGKVGKLMGNQSLGERIGGWGGVASGGILGMVAPGVVPSMIKKVGGMFDKTIDVAPAAVEEGVLKVPPERPSFPGEKPGYMASVPREELPAAARAGKPGAATQMQQLGKPVLYTPEGGYAPPRSKVTMAEPGKLPAPTTPEEEQFQRMFGPEYSEARDLAEWETGHPEGIRNAKQRDTVMREWPRTNQ